VTTLDQNAARLASSSLPGPAPTPLLSARAFDVREEFGEPGVCGTGGGAMVADVCREEEEGVCVVADAA
jgi:hypothetical protein